VEGGLNLPGRADVGRMAVWHPSPVAGRPGWQWAAGQQVLRKIEDLEEDCCRFTAGIKVCLIC
jgi:hypothetical protein